MPDYVNNISDYINSALLPRIRIRRITGADTAVLPPFYDSGAPMSCMAISCLLPYRGLPFDGMDVKIDDVSFRAESGDCLIFPEGCCRQFIRRDEGHRSIWAHLQFRLEPDLSLLQFFHTPCVIRGAAARRCRTLVSRLNRGCRTVLRGKDVRSVCERKAGGLTEQLEDQAVMFLLLKEILNLSTPRETLFLMIRGFPEFENAFLRIQKHKFEKLTLDQLAADCHMSRSSFEKKFRIVFGSSPGQYLINLKLAAAESLLRETGLTCAQIAERCGFSNQFLFSRLFSKRYKIPPRDYRNGRIFC
ncbi:MAG: helix-turn-helix transcriptional regulator [Lentisphaeria bacterium]|nr:helix-turn-helix transcriptional regulator [Lentisphaeria bacterium]